MRIRYLSTFKKYYYSINGKQLKDWKKELPLKQFRQMRSFYDKVFAYLAERKMIKIRFLPETFRFGFVGTIKTGLNLREQNRSTNG